MGVKANLTESMGVLGEDMWIRGNPGDMRPLVDDAGTITGFLIACPRCGIWGQISFVPHGTFKCPWRVTGGSVDDVTTLSVMDSILKKCCDWHGYLKCGVFEEC